METKATRKRRSQRLSDENFQSLKKICSRFSTKIDAAEFFNLPYQVLDMVLIKGSGSPATIGAIEEVIERSETTG